MNDINPTILVADDDPFNVDILLEYLEDTGYAVETVEDGPTAWRLLEANPDGYDVAILDRMMPGLDGIQVVQRVKRHPVLHSLPVILQTEPSRREEMVESLQHNACYYLPKPFEEEVLLSVLSTAVEDRMRYRRALAESDVANRTIGLLHEAVFSCDSLQAARDLATLLASAFPDPRRVVMGLSELLVNAVEHGNLGISHAEKGRLREQNRWEQEVDARLADAENAHKVVSVRFRREPDRIRVVIQDQGNGSDWQRYLETDPARARATHGRGIAVSRMISFDRIEYRGNGNEVEVSVDIPAR